MTSSEFGIYWKNNIFIFLKKLITFVIYFGQMAHISPILLCSLGSFLHIPSIYSFMLIVLSLWSSVLTVGIVIQTHGFIQGLRVYHDFCIRFDGCKLTEYYVTDYIDNFVWERANTMEISDGYKKIRTSDIRIKLYHVGRNEHGGANSPGLCSYVSFKPHSSYMFIPSLPERMTRPMAKFFLFHELGHVSLTSEYLVTPRYSGLTPLWYLPFWVLLNISAIANDWVILLNIIFIVASILGLVNQLKKENKVIDESEADQFAIKHLTDSECEVVLRNVHQLNDGLMDQKSNELRKDLCRKSLLNPLRKELFTTVKYSYELMFWYMIAAISGIILIWLGFSSHETSFELLINNALWLIIMPILVIVIIVIISLKVNVAVERAIESMTVNGKVKRTRFIDILEPLYKMTIHNK